MKKIFAIIFILFMALGIFSFFENVSANGAGASFDVGAGQQAPKVNLTYPWSNLRDPSALVSLIFKMALGIAGAAALGVLIYGAVLWTVSGAISSKQDAMEWIQGAIWGLVLLLGSYLILYTVNPDLVELKTPDELMAPVNIDVLATFENKYSPSTGLTDDIARAELAQAGIGLKNACPTGTFSGCVDLGGVRQQTLNEMGWLSGQVGGKNVFVTAGTEGCSGTISAVHAAGPTGHCGGYKVDLRINTSLNNYIQTTFKPCSKLPAGSCPNRTDVVEQYVSPNGSIYALEKTAALGAHWDVLVKQL